LAGTDSRLEHLLEGRENLFLYGDAPYESYYCVVSPYRHTCLLTCNEIAFNRALSSECISVEQAFGYVTLLWRANSLDVNLKVLLQPVAAWYEISVSLTNICTRLRGNVVSMCYGIEPPLLEEYLVVTP
jgi:hypothetical protein